MPTSNASSFAFESDDGEFVLYPDGSWEAHQDGAVVHGSAFSRVDLDALAIEAEAIRESKSYLPQNDRFGAQ